jgi:IclR family KDG regulon transcriptional repressor
MDYTVAAVDEALGLLFLVAENPGLGVTELAKRSSNTKARAFRLLSTLEGRGFVQRHGDPAVYKLGHRTLLLGIAAQSQIDLVSLAQRHLNELGQRFNETVHVRVRDGLESVCVAMYESTRDVRVGTHLGKRRPLHAGSSGKVILAFGSDDIREAILNSELTRYTPQTIVQRGKLAQELAKVKAQGYATSFGEVATDIRSLAVPVRDAKGQVIATMGMSVPANRAGEDAMATFVQEVVAKARLLSAELGYRETQRPA